MSVVSVLVDTAAPSRVTVSLNGGQPTTTVPEVGLLVIVNDKDIAELLVYGDVDPGANPNVQATSGASTWVPYVPTMSVVLSAGDGEKTITVKVRDDVGNTSPEFVSTVTLVNNDRPTVTILQKPRRLRYSSVTGYDQIEFSWRSDRPFVEYVVGLVSLPTDTHDAFVPLGSGTNISGSGTWAAGDQVTTIVQTSDLQEVSPGDGNKQIKVFVRNQSLGWSL